MWKRNVLGLLSAAMVVAAALPAGARAANPAPVSSGTITCAHGGETDINLPPVPASVSNPIFSVSSSGESAMLLNGINTGDPGYGANTIAPGETLWGSFNTALTAAQSPYVNVDCNTVGSLAVTLYAAPQAPTTFSGAASQVDTPFIFPFDVPGAAQYTASATVTQGAISLSQSSDQNGTTTASSGQVSLGSLTSGINKLYVTALPGPMAVFSITIQAAPVQISNLAFAKKSVKPASVATAKFSVSGATTITASVMNASGKTVDTLGSFQTSGAGSVTWSGRTSSGAPAPSGTYKLVLDSDDADGNQTSASAPLVVDGTPPVIKVDGGHGLNPNADLAARISDPFSGVASASVSVDGRHIAGGPHAGDPKSLQLAAASPHGGWLPGRQTYRITSTDAAGNTSTRSGSFTVPIGGRKIVLGARSFVSQYGRGWGHSRPAEIYNGGDPSGLIRDVHWTSWGGYTAHGVGRNAIFMPHGGYYPQLVPIQIRLTNLGRCTTDGPLAYRTMWVREPNRPGGPDGRWFRWSGSSTICQARYG